MSVLKILTRLSTSFGKTAATGTRCYSKVGFIGVGNMGSHMARNLVKKGCNVKVFDTNKSAVNDAAAKGAISVPSLTEMTKEVDIIISMLPTNDHVLDVYLGKNGIIRTAKNRTLLIDSSTIDPSVSQKISTEARQYDLRFVDGPVSGGVPAAKDGTLTFMVGGSKGDFDSAKRILEMMGSRIVHCGDIGMGQAAKLCNNMLLAISMIGTSEAFNLGQNLGLDSKVLAEIINSSTGRCWSSSVYNPVPGIQPNVPSSENYEGGFGTRLMAKDLGLAQAAALKTETPIPLGSLAHQIYRAIIAQGFSNKDFSIVYQFLKGKN